MAEDEIAYAGVDIPVQQDVCPDCGRVIEVGSWPWCPHNPGCHTVVPDDVPGGFTAENGFSEPRTFYSRSAHEKALAAEGYEIRAKNAGPHDTICPRWDTVNLAAAAALVQRGAQARAEKNARWKGADAVITVTDGEAFTGKDVNRAD